MSDPAAPAAPAAAPPAPATAPAATPPVAAAPPAAPPATPAAKTRVQSPGRAPFLERRNPAAQAAPAEQPAAAPAAPPAEPQRAKVPARVAKELETLRASGAEAKADREALATFAKTALSDAPANVQAFIKATVGDNPRAILNALANAKSNGLLAQPGLPTGATTTQPPAPAAADTNDADVAIAKKYRALVDAGKTQPADIMMTLHGARIERGLQKIQGRN